ncbi:MAG: FAD-binding oxidoreductase [Dehalococcoidales bacterium]|nr:FAD-binding oxidoreductase [Dehalococcoidales bacterium]
MIEKAKLIKAVGAGNISYDTPTLETYAKDISFVNAIKPDCVVKPRNTGDVEKLVKLARETLTPLVPVSSGPPHFKGDTVPAVGGAVVVDLSGMKKIIRVDRLNRVAMFEPGVTFGELIPAVTREKLRLNMPLFPRKTKSVTASMLEREPVVLPIYHWDLPDPLNCVEIIFGTGDMFRTGAAAGPGSLEEQWAAGGAQVTSSGPSSASWYRMIVGSQGTMGVVCWSSARCELLPQVEEPYFVGSTDLDKLMEMVHWLIRLRIPNECFILNKTNLATMVAKNYSKQYREIYDSLPPWILFYNLAGYDYFPEERVKVHEEDARGIAQRAQVEISRSAGKIGAFEFLKAAQAPSAEPYWKLRAANACQDIAFISNFQKVEVLIDVMYDAANQAGYPVPGIGTYIQPLVQGCNYHVEFNLFYDKNNRREADMVRKLTRDVVDPLIANGAFFSRPYGETARHILSKDAATVQMLKKVKTIFDPDNMMNPGKLCF